MNAVEDFHLKQVAARGLVETSDSGEAQLGLKGLAFRQGFFSNQAAQPQFFITSNLKHSLGIFRRPLKSHAVPVVGLQDQRCKAAPVVGVFG